MHPVLVAIIVVLVITFIAVATVLTVAAHHRQAATGREELLGKKATVVSALQPEGTVFIEGEIWQAALDQGQAQPGEEVIVTEVSGLKLRVTKPQSTSPGL